MSGMSMADVVGIGADYVDDREYDENGNIVYWTPPAGLRERFKVVAANAKDGDVPRFGLKLEILAGEHKGRQFWTNLGYTKSNERVNYETTQYLNALGLTTDYIVNATREEVAEALVGKEGIIIAGYRPNKDNPDRPWDNHRFVEAKTVRRKKKAPAPAVVDEDEEEEAPAPRKTKAKPSAPAAVEDDDDEWED